MEVSRVHVRITCSVELARTTIEQASSPVTEARKVEPGEKAMQRHEACRYAAVKSMQRADR